MSRQMASRTLTQEEEAMLVAASSSEGKISVMVDSSSWPAAEWKRPRYFAGYTHRAIVGPDNGMARFITFRSTFTPTQQTHGRAFGFCYGAYETRGEARNAAEIHGLPVFDARATKGGPHGR